MTEIDKFKIGNIYKFVVDSSNIQTTKFDSLFKIIDIPNRMFHYYRTETIEGYDYRTFSANSQIYKYSIPYNKFLIQQQFNSFLTQ